MGYVLLIAVFRQVTVTNILLAAIYITLVTK